MLLSSSVAPFGSYECSSFACSASSLGRWRLRGGEGSAARGGGSYGHGRNGLRKRGFNVAHALMRVAQRARGTREGGDARPSPHNCGSRSICIESCIESPPASRGARAHAHASHSCWPVTLPDPTNPGHGARLVTLAILLQAARFLAVAAAIVPS